MPKLTKEESLQTAFRIIRSPEICYLSTCDMTGMPETRAMLNLWNERNFRNLHRILDLGNFTSYFCTHASTRKVAQIITNPKGGAYFHAGLDGLYVAGSLSIVSDADIKRKAWDSGLNWDMKFETGLTDPEYTLIKLTPEYIKLYDQLVNVEIGV